jgi:hypothetical protein
MDVYTITVDSTQSSSNTQFITTCYRPLKDVVKIEVLRASVSTTIQVPAIYVHIYELVSTFNDRVLGENTLNTVTDQYGHTISYTASNKSQLLSEAIVSWNPESTPRTTFASKTHWDAITIYKEPIAKVGSLTISIVDNNGNIIDNNSTDVTFLTLKFYCKLHTPVPVPVPVPIEPKQKEMYVVQEPKKNKNIVYIVLAILLALGVKFFIMS